MTRLIPAFLFVVSIALIAGACGSGASRRDAYVNKGDRLLQSGAYSEAAINYQKAIQIDRNSGAAYRKLGMAEWKLRDFTAAFQALERAAALLPGDDGASEDLANLCLTSFLSDPGRPVTLYEKVNGIANRFLARDASSFAGLRLKGYLAMADSKPDLAVEFLEKAQTTRPFQPDVAMTLAQNLLLAGNPARAEELCLQLISRHPEFSPVYDLLYAYFMTAGEFDRAESTIKLKIANNRKESRYVVELCRYFERRHRPKEMAGCLETLAAGFPDGYVLAGDFRGGTGDWDGAIREYFEGARVHPENSLVCRKRVIAANIWAGRKEAAGEALEQLLREHPSDKEARGTRALLLVGSRRPEDARRAAAEFRKLVDETPDSADLHEKLAVADAAALDLAGARAEFAAALRIEGSSVNARLGLAEIALRTGQFPEALRYSGEILARDRRNSEARLFHAAALVGSGQIAEGRSELAAIVREWPENREANLQLATLDLARKDYKQAEDRYLRNYLPGNSDYRALKGLVEIHFARQDVSGAINLLEKEMKAHPESRDIRMLLGDTAIRAEQPRLAAAIFGELAGRYPSDIVIAVRFGNASLAAGDVSQAIGALQRARQTAPGDPAVLALLGSALERANRTGEAKSEYRECLRADPGNPLVLNNLAFLMLQSDDDLAGARRLIQQALRIAPQNAEFLDTQAMIYLKAGSTGSAFQILDNLVVRNPGNPTFHHHLGVALMRSGEEQRARKEFRRALELAPVAVEREQIVRLLGE